MICQAASMQLSAANLLIASQQLTRSTQPIPRDAAAQFAVVLAKEKSASSTAAFEPIEFPQAAAAEVHSAPATPLQPTATSAPTPVGSRIDIRV